MAPSHFTRIAWPGYLRAGAVCNNTGIQMPSVLAGFWRQVGNDDASKALDPYFRDYRIYPCNPPTVCLGTRQDNREGSLCGVD